MEGSRIPIPAGNNKRRRENSTVNIAAPTKKPNVTTANKLNDWRIKQLQKELGIKTTIASNAKPNLNSTRGKPHSPHDLKNFTTNIDTETPKQDSTPNPNPEDNEEWQTTDNRNRKISLTNSIPLTQQSCIHRPNRPEEQHQSS
ncbi:hypothetical protein PV326_008953 [Microctonus aethiopoides]|nr:hypothetical protein PV326_008953 [Microctonus aethiopoides]